MYIGPAIYLRFYARGAGSETDPKESRDKTRVWCCPGTGIRVHLIPIRFSLAEDNPGLGVYRIF